jgi:hypothetical protein
VLVDPKFPRQDVNLAFVLAMIGGGNGGAEKLQQGVYKIKHFSFNHMIGWKDRFVEGSWEMTPKSGYGVADNVDQILAYHPELTDPETRYCLSVTEIRRDDQPESGGWRWHKWGEYIGSQNPQCEYLYNETGIESVLVYHFYELEPHQIDGALLCDDPQRMKRLADPAIVTGGISQ